MWTAVEGAASGGAGVGSFLNELVWREFAHHTLWDRPELLERPFRPAFEGFPWRSDARSWRAWAAGRTGYPVVDAAARQLLGEGFVHNRARMISASFLAKHLLVDFRRGEAHYLRHLADADVASNDLGWQWSAGCGCDAQPWFRVFNPVAQGERFDPEGAYVRRWVPELSRLPARWVHRPWEAPPDALAAAGVRLGVDYPRPIVDHALARARFLEVPNFPERGAYAEDTAQTIDAEAGVNITSVGDRYCYDSMVLPGRCTDESGRAVSNPGITTGRRMFETGRVGEDTGPNRIEGRPNYFGYNVQIGDGLLQFDPNITFRDITERREAEKKGLFKRIFG